MINSEKDIKKATSDPEVSLSVDDFLEGTINSLDNNKDVNKDLWEIIKEDIIKSKKDIETIIASINGLLEKKAQIDG